MRCNNCIHYDVCYQYDIIGEDDSEMCALYEQKRPHGEWKQVGEMTYKCTKCGWIKKTGLMPYCPNCGSDNRKVGESK